MFDNFTPFLTFFKLNYIAYHFFFVFVWVGLNYFLIDRKDVLKLKLKIKKKNNILVPNLLYFNI